MSDQPSIVLTDPAPLPRTKDRSCERCGSDRRRKASGFGRAGREVCANCGQDLPRDEDME